MIKVIVGMTLDGWVPGTWAIILMLRDFQFIFLYKETGIRNK